MRPRTSDVERRPAREDASSRWPFVGLALAGLALLIDIQFGPEVWWIFTRPRHSPVEESLETFGQGHDGHTADGPRNLPTNVAALSDRSAMVENDTHDLVLFPERDDMATRIAADKRREEEALDYFRTSGALMTVQLEVLHCAMEAYVAQEPDAPTPKDAIELCME